MFLGDKGKKSKFQNIRRNYDIYEKNEKKTLNKLDRALNFFNLSPKSKIKETEIVYDTPNRLFTSTGLILSKKILPKRNYFRISRSNMIKDVSTTETKHFLGECELKDEPRDFPAEIAKGLNDFMPNLFAVDLLTIVSHLEPYVKIDITGESYQLSSGTGYSATLSFETHKYTNLSKQKIKNSRQNMKKRIFSVEMPNDPTFIEERRQIMTAIEKNCKELVPFDRNRFEIAKALLFPQVKEVEKVSRKQLREKQKKVENSLE